MNIKALSLSHQTQIPQTLKALSLVTTEGKKVHIHLTQNPGISSVWTIPWVNEGLANILPCRALPRARE